MNQLSELLQVPAETANLEIPLLLLSLALGVALGGLMRAQYVRFAGSLANRELFANNFIPIILAVTLIISIVKASLAMYARLASSPSIQAIRSSTLRLQRSP